MKQILCFLMVLVVAGCKERYDSPVQSPVTGYLVIDGVLNSGADTGSIQLSRTTKFDSRAMVYETRATVKIEGDNGTTYTLAEKNNGLYAYANLNLNPAAKYRLHITTSSKKDYLSDFESVIPNPPIDSVSWTRNADGLQLSINTHNSLNNTRYYQWMYNETWQIQSPYASSLKYKIQTGKYSVVYRDSSSFSYDPTIINCWQNFSSTAILLGSSAKQTQDIIFLPLTTIPAGSIKLSVKYSIIVKQYAWKKEGYQFLELMKKNTESTGSIFDAQPSELKGNIHNTADANEPVIGYFNICNLQQKRIFISSADVFGWGYQSGCNTVEVENVSDSILKKAVGLLPTAPTDYSPSGAIAKFEAAPPECVDCTLRGSNVKPTFWP